MHGYVTLNLLNRLLLGESDILIKNQVQSNYFLLFCNNVSPLSSVFVG